MVKPLKLKIKNIQLAGIGKEEKEKSPPAKEKVSKAKPKEKEALPETEESAPRKIRAKNRSSFGQVEESATTELPAQEGVEESKSEEVLAPEPAKSASAIEEVRESTSPAPPPPPLPAKSLPPEERQEKAEKLGPTGRHVKDFYQPPKKESRSTQTPSTPVSAATPSTAKPQERVQEKKPLPASTPTTAEEEEKKARKKVRDFKDVRPRKEMRVFETRSDDESERWRKRRPQKAERRSSDEPVIRPTKLKVRVPITIKDLASEMKLKSSEIIQKLFLQGMVCTLNDFLEDPTLLHFIGAEFSCEISIDSSEEERIEITKKTIQEEIDLSQSAELEIRPPVVAFMGHVDHGKTSLIDAIRKSNVAASEAGAITQHIGAFRCQTAVGSITILDTPGHEAFSEMRARGAEVTDIVVLVVAGDEGIREQTLEAIEHAKSAGVTIIVAINKSDKPNFNPENIYRQLSEANLLPEVWGGQIITVATSAVTGKGIPELLEMLALQAEVLELNANPHARARGTVLESELHKGYGPVATILIQNGTLRLNDAIVLDHLWGRVKTMRDEFGKPLTEASPAAPVRITGLSGVPEAGDSFIVVKSEKEAREIAEARVVGVKQKALLQKKVAPMESLLKQESDKEKKVLRLVLRTDVQGSMEALKASLGKIHSDKVVLDIIYSGVGEITESDIQLASASKAVILGFHSEVESRASTLIKELNVTVKLHDIIYHAVDDVRALMKELLDKIAEEKDCGKAEVKAVFKASQLGQIAGCQVIEGTIIRNNKVRVLRGQSVIWKGSIASLKRVKEDVREVKKGLECGILLDGFSDFQVGDILQAYEITYRTQEL